MGLNERLQHPLHWNDSGATRDGLCSLDNAECLWHWMAVRTWVADLPNDEASVNAFWRRLSPDAKWHTRASLLAFCDWKLKDMSE